MTSPIERKPNNDKTIMPLRGEGNQSEFNKIPQSETTYINHNFGNSIIGEIKQSEIIGENHA